MAGMNTRAMLVAILCGVCVSLAAVVVWQKQRLDRAGAGSGPAESSVVLPPAVSPMGEPPAAPPPAVPRPAPETPVAAVPAEPSGPTSPPAAEKAPAQQFMAALAKMVQDPKMKDALRAQQRMAIDTGYGQLFKCLTSRPESVAAFKDLLLERQMAMMDLGLGVVAAKSTEQREADAKRIQEAQKEFDTQAQGLLGADDYAMYKEYEETQPERMQVSAFGQGLGGSDALTEAQQHDLIRAMYEERKAFKFSVPAGADADPTAVLAPGAASRHVQDLEALQARYMERAQAILSPAQTEAFRKAQDQQRQMQAMGIQMAVQMMGTSEEK
jgi:hypothetical protein